MEARSVLIPLTTKVVFSEPKDNRSVTTTNGSSTTRNDSIVFVVFLTENLAFINSVYDDPPTYDSGRKKCHIVDAEMYKKDLQAYETACIFFLQSGKFQRVHVYMDPFNTMMTKLMNNIVEVCNSMGIVSDVTTIPIPENNNSPRTLRLKTYTDSHEDVHTANAKQSKRELLQQLECISEKMNMILQGKLLHTKDIPEDADTVFAFHQCWKDMYDIIKEEKQRRTPRQTRSHCTPEELQLQRLYSMDVRNFYEQIEL